MTVTTALAALAVRFQAIDVTGQPDIARVHTALHEALNLADFPVAVLVKAKAGAEHVLAQQTMGSPGLGRHSYQVQWFIFIASASVPTPEASARLEPWGQAVMVALLADQTLSGAVAHIGDDDTGLLTTYQEGLIPWIDNKQYWGLKGLLPVTENILTPVG